MPARVMSWVEEAVRWGAAIPVMAMIVLAAVQAIVLPARLWAKGVWLLAIATCAALAGAGAIRQERMQEQTSADHAGEQLEALRGLWTQWDVLARTLPAARGNAPSASFETFNDAVASLDAKAASVEAQIAVLREQSKNRTFDDETAAKLADYLRQYGRHRVVVSCVPGDVEAYTYANQLANVLRAAGWEAAGPEVTKALGEAAAMGVSLYVRDPRAPDAAKILIDAFTRFNIPIQSGVAANAAIPDLATVELFVARKPGSGD